MGTRQTAINLDNLQSQSLVEMRFFVPPSTTEGENSEGVTIKSAEVFITIGVCTLTHLTSISIVLRIFKECCLDTQRLCNQLDRELLLYPKYSCLCQGMADNRTLMTVSLII